jgi:hypothetical protein
MVVSLDISAEELGTPSRPQFGGGKQHEFAA